MTADTQPDATTSATTGPSTQGPLDAGTHAAGATTLSEHVAAAESDGYDAQFIARPDGQIRCGGCDQLLNPASIHVDAVHRTEGASDVADMSLLARCRCPRCGACGVLIVGYGPNADEGALAVLPHIDLATADTGPEEAT